MPTKNEIIGNVYKKYLGSRAQTLDRIKSDDKKKSEADRTGIPKRTSTIGSQITIRWPLP